MVLLHTPSPRFAGLGWPGQSLCGIQPGGQPLRAENGRLQSIVRAKMSQAAIMEWREEE